jgi:hypothetical protein
MHLKYPPVPITFRHIARNDRPGERIRQDRTNDHQRNSRQPHA